MPRLKLVTALTVATTALLLLPRAALAWAPAGSASVHPGVQTFTEGAQCTSNFVFQEGSTVFLGQAAHCSGTGGQTETDGCTSGSLPLGTPVEVTGAGKAGALAYNSWLTMQADGERDADTCAYNDLALVKLDPADVGSVNPSVPGYGGPTGVGSAGEPGATVFTYGNSELRGGIAKLSPKQGTLIENEGGGWSHIVGTVSPGIPGDSGSGFMNEAGQAIGVLSTLQIAPLAGTNGVGDIAKEIAYERAQGPYPNLQLVPGGPRPSTRAWSAPSSAPSPAAPRASRRGRGGRCPSPTARPAPSATARAGGPSKARRRCGRGRRGRAPR